MKNWAVIICFAVVTLLGGRAEALSCIGFPFETRVRQSEHVVVVEVLGETKRAGASGFTMRVLKILKGGAFIAGRPTFFYAQGQGWEMRSFRRGGIYILLFSGAPRPTRCNYPIQLK